MDKIFEKRLKNKMDKKEDIEIWSNEYTIILRYNKNNDYYSYDILEESDRENIDFKQVESSLYWDNIYKSVTSESLYIFLGNNGKKYYIEYIKP